MKPSSPNSPEPLRTVCGRMMTTDPANYPQAIHHGKVIYFCTEYCLDAYNADPERFYQAHSLSPRERRDTPPTPDK